jgi:hypothetical protein
MSLIAIPELKFVGAPEHNVTAFYSHLGNTAQFHCGFEYESKLKRVDTHGRVEFEDMPVVSWHLSDRGFSAEGKHFSMSKIAQIFLQLAQHGLREGRYLFEMDVYLDESQCARPGNPHGVPRLSPNYKRDPDYTLSRLFKS